MDDDQAKGRDNDEMMLNQRYQNNIMGKYMTRVENKATRYQKMRRKI